MMHACPAVCFFKHIGLLIDELFRLSTQQMSMFYVCSLD